MHNTTESIDDVARRRARREDGGNARLLECGDVRLGHDAAADDQRVRHALAAHKLDNLGEEMRMSAREDAQRDDIDVFLQSCFRNLLRRLAKACVNDLESCVTKSARDDFRAAVMTVQARFCYQYPDFCHLKLPPDPSRERNTGGGRPKNGRLFPKKPANYRDV